MYLIHPGLQDVIIGRATFSPFECLADALEQFVALLDDGEIGRELGVEHAVKTEGAQARDHLAGDGVAGFEAELFADGGANGGSRLHDDELVGIRQRVPNLLGVVPLHDCAHRADGRTLAAIDAGHLRQGGVERRGDGRRESALAREQDADFLNFLANGDAAAAQDAF